MQQIDKKLTSSKPVEIRFLVIPSMVSRSTTVLGPPEIKKVGWPPILVFPLFINVCMPVNVARGISGSSSIFSLPDRNCLRLQADLKRSFLFIYQNLWRFWASRSRDSRATKKERNAEKDTIMSAVQASVWFQKSPHTMSRLLGPRITDMRIIAIIVITIERHRVAPKTSFWRKLILICQSIWIGMISTKKFKWVSPTKSSC